MLRVAEFFYISWQTRPCVQMAFTAKRAYTVFRGKGLGMPNLTRQKLVTEVLKAACLWLACGVHNLCEATMQVHAPNSSSVEVMRSCGTIDWKMASSASMYHQTVHWFRSLNKCLSSCCRPAPRTLRVETPTEKDQGCTASPPSCCPRTPEGHQNWWCCEPHLIFTTKRERLLAFI